MKARDCYLDSLNRLDSDPKGRLCAQEKVKASGVKAHGKPFQFSYIPLFVDEEAEHLFESMIQQADSILNKVTAHYIEDAEYRAVFGFSREMEELICLPCGYEITIPTGRYDYFFDEESGNYQICEFNTDGSGGMSLNYVVSDAILSSFGDKEFLDTYAAAPYPTIESIAEGLLKIYRTDINEIENPVFCITDFIEEATMADFELFISAFRRLGFCARFTDIRDLAFDGERLYDRTDGTTIDAIYRRAISSTILRHIDECSGLIQAVAARKVVLLGHFRTSLAFSKRIHYALRHPMTAAFLTKEENAWVHEHIPVTYPLTAAFAETPEFKAVLGHKDDWIVKPMEGFASEGVVSGMDIDADEWNALIKNRVDRDYLVQQFCRRSCIDVMYADSGRMEKLPLMLGIYQAGGHFAGCYSRAGNSGVIDYNHGGILVSTVRVCAATGDDEGKRIHGCVL